MTIDWVGKRSLSQRAQVRRPSSTCTLGGDSVEYCGSQAAHEASLLSRSVGLHNVKAAPSLAPPSYSAPGVQAMGI